MHVMVYKGGTMSEKPIQLPIHKAFKETADACGKEADQFEQWAAQAGDGASRKFFKLKAAAARDAQKFYQRASARSFSERLLAALRGLTKECEPHPCGGFTTDDMQWRMGTAFTDEQVLLSAIDELAEARLIRYAGYDEDDAIGHCYALIVPPTSPA